MDWNYIAYLLAFPGEIPRSKHNTSLISFNPFCDLIFEDPVQTSDEIFHSCTFTIKHFQDTCIIREFLAVLNLHKFSANHWIYFLISQFSKNLSFNLIPQCKRTPNFGQMYKIDCLANVWSLNLVSYWWQWSKEKKILWNIFLLINFFSND